MKPSKRKTRPASSRISLDPPDETEHDEDCAAWAHREGCTCPTYADLEAIYGDERNKSELEG